MALSFSSVTAQNIHSILRPFGSELAFTCTSTTSLANKEVFIVPMFFVRGDDVQSLLSGDYPRYGYRHTFPASNGTANMTKLSHDYDFCHENVRLSFTRSSTTQFTITPYGLTTMDVGRSPSTFQLDSLDRCMKSHRLSVKRLENVTPSVFYEDRVMRFYVVVTDGDYQVEQQGVVDIDFTARFYEDGLYGVDSEWSEFEYKLFQNGSPIDGLSLHTDTVIRLQFNKGATYDWNGGWWVYIFRENGHTNSSNYWDDIKLNGKFFSASGVGSPAITGVDSAGIVSSSAITNLSGSINYVDVILSSDYFEKGHIYRCVFVPTKINDFSNSFITETLKVTDYVTPTKGDVTDEIMHYDKTYNVFLNCVKGVAVGERLRFSATMDKDSYNLNIQTNNSNGSFDTNLKDYKLYVTEQIIHDGQKLTYEDAESVGDYGINNTATEHGGITTLRMQEDWEGKTMFLTHEWTFDIKLDNGLKSQDVVYYQQAFTVEDKVTDSDIEFIGFFNQSGEAVTKICSASNEVFIARFNKVIVGDYSLIAILDNEKNTWANTNFIKLNSQPITLLPDTFDGSDNVDIEIDSKLLDIDKTYTLQLIGISDTNSTAVCSAKDIDVSLEILSPQNIGLWMEFSYSGFTGSLKKVWVDFIGYGFHKVLAKQEYSFTSESSSGSYNFIFYTPINSNYTTCDLDFKMTVLTTDGCYLTKTFNLNTVTLIKPTETKTITLDVT